MNEMTAGVATRDGKLITFDPEKLVPKDLVELDPPAPIWRVVGNHHPTPMDCDFALATLNAGVIGVKGKKGVIWQHPFGSSCGAITFAHREADDKQLIIAGGLDKTLRGIEPATGKLVWGQVFLEGVGFVETFDVGQETLAVAGDAAGNVRCYDAFTGTMRWHGEFGQNARFCVPIPSNKGKDPQWMVGTDEKAIHLFEINNKGKAVVLSSMTVKEYPWQARRILNNTIVSVYDFANLGESTTVSPGELIALSMTGQVLWKATLAGSAEDFDIVPGNHAKPTRIFVATNAGVIMSIDAVKGHVLDKLALSGSSVNCIKVLPSRRTQEGALVTACDDGRVIRAQ